MTPSTPPTILRRLPIALVAFATALVVAQGTAVAGGPAVLVKVHPHSGVASTYFILHGRAGKTVAAGTLEIDNPTGRRVRARLDPVDGVTTNTLGSAYQLRGSAVHGSTNWLRLGARVVDLRPHGRMTVPVRVSVPRSAKPGDYLAGVAVEALNQSNRAKMGHGLAIGETDRYAVGVELTVPGPRHPLVRFSGAGLQREPAGLTFLLFAHNRGNVILKNVHGSALVTRGSRRVAAQTISPGTFVSGTSIAYPIPALREQPKEGTKYRVRATLYYRGGIARLDTLVVFGHAAAVIQQQYGGPKAGGSGGGFQWWMAALAGALAALLLLAFGRRRRRRPLPLARTLALLERELEGVAAGRALSVVYVGLEEQNRRRVVKMLRGRLRKADRLCDLGGYCFLIVAPDTGREMAAGLAADTGAFLEREGIAASVGAAMAADGMEPRELISAAQGRREESLAELDALNLSVPQAEDRDSV